HRAPLRAAADPLRNPRSGGSRTGKAVVRGGEEAAPPPLGRDARPLWGRPPLGAETRAFGGGSPAGVINDLAEREGVETIIVGSPHRGAIGRVVIGSVADGLLHGAPCEVVVAPSGYAKEEQGPFRRIAVAYDDTPEAKAALARAEAIALACRATIVVYTVSAPPTVVPGAAGYTPTI